MCSDTFLPESDLGKPINRYYEKFHNKRYLARKQRRLDRQSVQKDESRMRGDEMFSPDPSLPLSLVTRIVSSPRSRLVALQSGGETREITIPYTTPLASRLIIGDLLARDGVGEWQIAPRSNCLARSHGDVSSFSLRKRVIQPIAVNLDRVMIVASARDPDFQIGFIDRYLVLAESCHIPVAIVITKSDLASISDPTLEYYQRMLEIPVFLASSSLATPLDPALHFLRSALYSLQSPSQGKTKPRDSVLALIKLVYYYRWGILRSCFVLDPYNVGSA